jgi:long-chain acyl-CoA synthetase
MALDIELYRRIIYAPAAGHSQTLRRISVIDIHPEGATRTLLFVHGYGGSVTQWLYQLRFFGQTMHVIAPDLRGHGLSDDPVGLPHTMDGLVDDLDIVLDALYVREPVHIISHSFGGAVATEYSLRHPERVLGLVLIGVPTRFIIQPLIRLLMKVPDPLFSRAAKTYGVALYASQRTLKAMLDSTMTRWQGGERIQQLTVPTLVVLGQRDMVFLREHYEDMARFIPNVQKVVIPVSAHLVQLERPDAVNRAINRFIGKKQPSPVGAGVDRRGGEDAERGPLRSPTRGDVATLAHVARHIEMPWLQSYDSDVPEEVPRPKQLVHDMLSNAAWDFPDHPAIIFFAQKISYRELDLLSNRFAHALQELGLKAGDRVMVTLPNLPQCVIAFYGTLKARGIVVFGSPLSTEEEVRYQLRHSGAQILLTLESHRTVVERVCADTYVKHVIYTDVREYLPIRPRLLLASLIDGIKPHTSLSANTTSTADGETSNVVVPLAGTRQIPGTRQIRDYSFQQLLRRQPTTPMDSSSPISRGSTTSKDLALIQYTSGTTDTPKGVMLSHGNLMANVAQVRHWIPDARRGREIILAVLPLSHSYGTTDCMNLAAALACTLLLVPTTRTDQLLEEIRHHRPTIFPGIPALYLAIANYPKVRSYGVSAIRFCVSGSAPLPVEVQEAFEKLTRGRLVEGYGLTEASPVTHSNPLKGERRVGSIGIPLPSTQARIVDIETGEIIPPGEVGELLIRGPQVMQGYWQMPEETVQALRDGWLHTGDLARMDEDGFFTIVDRKKDLILSGPYNVYPRDVEEVLYEHPKVLEAAVVSTPSPATYGDSDGNGNGTPASPFIKAVVVLKRGEQATADELLALCRERLDAYKVPRQIEFRTELPKNIVGKVLRRLLIEA